MELYSVIKIVHVLAITVWVLGLLWLSSVTGFSAASAASLRRMARWNHRLVLPAMALTWCCGLVMGGMVGWFGQLWLDVKVALVVLLTLLQLWQTRVLTRMLDKQEYRAPEWMSLAGATVFLLTALAITLAVAKPFF
ncbi:CopD family protein [Bordetella holmesii]|uniref:Protoporphyrinogen IX oxidase n=2 Tax=Bordetella holmesii TaxID=35814 RepID=A0A158M9Z9_9BORD|nr:CopD family protein [Bordetella holmesii]AHV91116.1 hypothetical protein D560_1911 [Bordetella holmesii ATCC 51541]EWM42579.1 hypothetical protein D556_1908 [Bordetella holmesii 41130]EWM47144.1 hypothetical protein D555_1927 [Bordetella holmesii 35009]EWM51308.1 hypothetical protein D557_1161 [Bordetella holmesii 70147]AMD45558.1 hypothetical protein H558_08635 [Bordetella holmesii H558]